MGSFRCLLVIRGRSLWEKIKDLSAGIPFFPALDTGWHQSGAFCTGIGIQVIFVVYMIGISLFLAGFLIRVFSVFHHTPPFYYWQWFWRIVCQKKSFLYIFCIFLSEARPVLIKKFDNIITKIVEISVRCVILVLNK